MSGVDGWALGQSPAAGSVSSGRADWIGVLCSVSCAVHCAVTPIVLAALPTLTSIRWLSHPLFHQVVAVVCGCLVLRAIVPGWRKHRDPGVAVLSVVGLGLLFVAAFVLPDSCCSPLESNAVAVAVVSDAGSGLSARAPGLAPELQWVGCRLSAEYLAATLGASAAERLTSFQPFLAPLGGMLLIVAHLMNVGSRRCAPKR